MRKNAHKGLVVTVVGPLDADDAAWTEDTDGGEGYGASADDPRLAPDHPRPAPDRH